MPKTLKASYVLDATGVKSGVDEADSQFGRLQGQSDKLSSAVDDDTSRLGNGFRSLGTELGNFGIPLSGALTNMGDKLDEAKTKGNSFGQVMSTIGGTTLLVGAAGFAAVAAESVHLAQNFQSTVTSIAANADIPVQAAQKIGQAFLGTAGSTIYSGQQIATAYSAVAGELGATQGKALSASQALSVMKNAMDLAEGSGTDLNTATSALASTMQAYGAKADEAEHYTDVLYNTSRITGTGISSVAASFAKLHSTLGAVTPDIGQLGGMLVELTEHGETGRKALSAINTSLNGMLAPTAAVKNAQDLMGISVFNASGQFVGMGSLIDQLQPKLVGMTQEQQLAALKAIGLGTANKALLTTILAGPEAFDKATSAASRMGSAHEAAEKQSQTLDHELDTMKATVTDLATNFGEELIPKLNDALHVTEESVNWMEQHKTVAEALGIAIGTFLAGAVAVYTVNMTTGMIASTKSALTSIGLLSAAEAEAETDTAALTTSVVSLESALIPAAAAEDAVAAAQDALNAAMLDAQALMATNLEGLAALATANGELAGAEEVAGAAAEASAAQMDVARASAGGAGLAGGLGEAGAGATGLAGGLGALVLPLGAVALGMYGLVSILPNGTAEITAFQNALDKAAAIPTTGVDALNQKIGITQQVLDKASAAAKAYQTQIGATGDAGAAAGGRGRGVASGPDLATVTNEASTALTKYNALLSVANTNTSELSSITGLSATSVKALAGTLGVNLTKALDPKTIQAFTNYVKENGGAAAVTGAEWTASAALMQAALEKTEAQAAVSMPNISKAAQTMVATTQPKLVSLVSDLEKTGDSAGGGFVSAFLAHLSPAQMASADMHNAVKSPLLPLEEELRAIGDTSAAKQIAAFISHVPAAAAAAYTMKGSILGPINGIVGAMQTTGDNAGMNLVQSFLNHNPGALAAANEMRGSVASKLQPLEEDLQAVGDTSGANVVAGIMKHDSDAAQQAQFLHDSIKHPLDPLLMELGMAGDTSAAALVQDFSKHNPDAAASSKSLHDSLKSPLLGLADDLSAIGQTSAAALVQSFINGSGAASGAGSGIGNDFDTGVASGITSSSGVVVNAAQGMVQAVIVGSRTSLKAKSPSKVAADLIGSTIPQGVAQGILAGTPGAVSAANQMIQTILTKTALQSNLSEMNWAADMAKSAETAWAASGSPGMPIMSGAADGIVKDLVGGTAPAGSTASSVVVNVAVAGNVLDGRQLTDLVYQGLLQKGLVNGSNGQLVLAS